MANRVLMGLRAGTYGAWVSKPGVDVLTAGVDQLLLSTDIGNVQAIASGSISGAGTGTVISWTDLGYQPWVILGSEYRQFSFTYTSNSSISLTNLGLNPLVASWNVGSPPSFSDEVRYVVLNIPRP